MSAIFKRGIACLRMETHGPHPACLLQFTSLEFLSGNFQSVCSRDYRPESYQEKYVPRIVQQKGSTAFFAAGSNFVGARHCRARSPQANRILKDRPIGRTATQTSEPTAKRPATFAKVALRNTQAAFRKEALSPRRDQSNRK